MHLTNLLHSKAFRIYAIIFCVGVAWSLYTNHAWEDYYITYRASKNLATGQGLTFTAGERVHSFTSPLGVLLPALANLLAAHKSDYAALWIFRLWSIAAYAGAGVLLWRLAISALSRSIVSALLVILFAIDAKIVDFSTNGMETGFLLLFLAWTLNALMTPLPRQRLQLGLAWAGLMWTRPDSFIYIGVLSIGSLLFWPGTRAPGHWRRRFSTLSSAGLITTLLYLPWLLWAWSYYGTPVPHTIVAKGLFHAPTTVTSLATALWKFPASVVAHHDILTTTFMPPYSFNTGWPAVALNVYYWISALCLIVWLIPGIRPITKLASFAFFWGEFYLTAFVEFPVPWYIPTLTVFALLTVCGLIDQLLGSTKSAEFASGAVTRFRDVALIGICAALVAGTLTVTLLAARQLKFQQSIIEHGQRREIGRWLRANASRGDTVFLEPLGYIGFYSNLKMLDYPGLSSPEVVTARRRASTAAYPDCWPELITDLTPTWLVLRNYESDTIRKQSPELLTDTYSLKKTFDVRAQVNAVEHLEGRGYLLNDAVFEVYRLNEHQRRNGQAVAATRRIRVAELRSNEAFGGPAKQVGLKIAAHAPSRLQVERLVSARWLSGAFGLEPGSYENSAASTDGASFRIYFVTADGARQELFRRDLNPRDQPADRGSQRFLVDLPGDSTGTLELEINPGPNGSNAFDWGYWSFLRFELPGTN